MSEAELLESYKRRDNIRIVGLKEDRSSDKVSESYPQSIQNVLQLAEKVGAKIASQDTLIAYRLPIRNQSKERQTIVKFSRRVAKIEMLQKKRTLEHCKI